jgi:hypothetical protein
MLIWNSPFTILGIMGSAICTVRSPFAALFTQVPLGGGEERHVEKELSLCRRGREGEREREFEVNSSVEVTIVRVLRVIRERGGM